VSIGERLARARRDAGLSVADISNQTRIRPSVIERIERDEYAASGIDFFARREIREIAAAVGVDSKPLVEEYDAIRLPPDPPPPLPPAEPTVAALVYGTIRPLIAEVRRFSWIWRIGLALLTVASLGGGLLVWGTSGHGVRPAAASTRPRARHAGASKADAQPRSPAHAGRTSGNSASPTPSGSRAVQVLRPTAIAAFGPGGTAQGDSPQLARMALAGKAATPWHRAWYATPQFGNLQSGTGLLLDMGRVVTVTGARIALGSGPGADLELRIGIAPVLADLKPVARASDVGHVVQLRAQPTRGRYVLVWFTRLPPDQAGTFQVLVYDIKVFGYR
jgi:Helix-turn-helix domain